MSFDFDPTSDQIHPDDYPRIVGRLPGAEHLRPKPPRFIRGNRCEGTVRIPWSAEKRFVTDWVEIWDAAGYIGGWSVMSADFNGAPDHHLDMAQLSDPTQQAESPSRPVTSRRQGTSATERKRQQRARDRASLVYETADWQLFADVATLPQKAGCQPQYIRQVVLKELVDNALDAGAKVSLDRDGNTWVVSDDGPGIDPTDVPKLFAVNRPLLSTKLRRLPLRGMLGNGLRVVIGAVAAFGGTLMVETRGRRLTLFICTLTGRTTIWGHRTICSKLHVKQDFSRQAVFRDAIQKQAICSASGKCDAWRHFFSSNINIAI